MERKFGYENKLSSFFNRKFLSKTKLWQSIFFLFLHCSLKIKSKSKKAVDLFFFTPINIQNAYLLDQKTAAERCFQYNNA